MNYRKDIQILRGIAVLLVVCFHLGFASFNSGFLGVDVFFVISGFLMSVLYDDNQKLGFLKRRALRLLPTYYVTIIFTVIVSIFLVTPNEYRQVFDQAIYADFFSSNIGFWMQNSYFSKEEFNPLLHLWSLGVEIQFYLLLPILIYFQKINKYFLWLLFIISIILCFTVLGMSTKTAFFMLPFRLWEFLIGYFIAKYMTDNGNVIKSYPLVGTFFLVIILVIPLFEVDGVSLSFINGHPGLYALFITLATAGVLSLGITKVLEESKLGSLLALMGQYSYSIYLVHFPVIVLFLYKPFSGTKLQPNNYFDLILVTIMIIVLSYFMYHLVENKLRKSKHINKFLFIVPVFIIFMAFLGTYIQKHIYTKNEMLIFDAFKDRDIYRCGKTFRLLHPSAQTCKLSENNIVGAKGILFVGNSHADSIKSSFLSVTDDAHINLYFMVSNSPLMKGNYINPQKLIAQAEYLGVKEIVLHYSPKAVEISIIKEVIKISDKKNIFVSFIMPVPVWNEHIPKALWKHHQDYIKLPSQTLDEYNKKNKQLYEALNKIKSRNFKLYSVAKYFCDKECLLIDKSNKPLYFDNGHLTLTGSHRLIELFERISQHSD